MSAPRPALDALPAEILHNILGNFKVTSFNDSGYMDGLNWPIINLFNFSLTSKRLNEKTTPFLYNTLVQTRKNALPAFTRRLSAAPELGRFVKRVFCDSGVEGALDMTTFTQDDFARCTVIIQKAASDDETALSWIHSLKNGDWDAVFSLLLCQAPFLEEIELYGEGSYQWDTSLRNEILATAARLQSKNDHSPLSLSHLRSVGLFYSETEDGLDVSLVESFVSLKSVEKFYINMLSMGEGDGGEEESQDGNSVTYHTKDLDLGYSEIDPSIVVGFLQKFKSLERLTYSYGAGRFAGAKWGQAIAHLTSTLQMLDIQGEYDGDGGYPEDKGLIGSLAQFQCLKEIFVQSRLLLDSSDDEVHSKRLISILPKSLEKLVIIFCNSNCMRQLIELVGRKEDCVPALKVVMVDEMAEFEDKALEIQLLHACKAAEVELKFTGDYEPRSGSQE